MYGSPSDVLTQAQAPCTLLISVISAVYDLEGSAVTQPLSYLLIRNTEAISASTGDRSS